MNALLGRGKLIIDFQIEVQPVGKWRRGTAAFNFSEGICFGFRTNRSIISLARSPVSGVNHRTHHHRRRVPVFANADPGYGLKKKLTNLRSENERPKGQRPRL
jgi:hypothetical protein